MGLDTNDTEAWQWKTGINPWLLFWRGDKNNIGGTWFYAPFWLEREEGTNDGQTHSCALQSMHCLALCSWSTCLLWINNTDFFSSRFFLALPPFHWSQKLKHCMFSKIFEILFFIITNLLPLYNTNHKIRGWTQ